MQDRLKFRVWNIDKKQYVEGVVLFSDGNIDTVDMMHYEIGYDDNTNRNCVIEQCTGLKDINDNLIYEGDIIIGRGTNSDYDKDGNDIKCEVVWDQEYCEWVLRRLNSDLQLSLYNANWEIVGNIHAATVKDGE